MDAFPSHRRELQMTSFASVKDITRAFDLEERLINFASSIIKLSESLPQSFAGRHIAGQLIRSGTAPALQYGEAQGAESRKDFIHKMKVALKELRETSNGLRIVERVNWLPTDTLDPILDENNQLISIFVRSIETATTNDRKNYQTK
jgi:four helix bundle protein